LCGADVVHTSAEICRPSESGCCAPAMVQVDGGTECPVNEEIVEFVFEQYPSLTVWRDRGHG